MAEASDTMGILHQNLIDARCSEELTQSCMELAKAGQWNRILPLLSKHKVDLLATVRHVGQQIDCLDFLVYSINKKHI